MGVLHKNIMVSTATTSLVSILLSLVAFSRGAVVPGECGEGRQCVPHKSCQVSQEALATELIESSRCHLASVFPEPLADHLKPRSCCKKGETCCDIKDIIKTSVDPPTTSGPSVDPPTTSVPSAGPNPSFVATKLGNFITFYNEVSGTVSALTENILLIEEFNYDGKGLAPIFLAGTSGTPGRDGEVDLAFPNNTETRGANIQLNLPAGFTVDQLKWIAVLSEGSKKVLGSLQFNGSPTTSDPSVDPQTTNGPLGNFTTSFNEVSGTVTKHSERALLIDDFNYDGKNGLAVFLGGITGSPSGDGEVAFSDPKLDTEYSGNLVLNVPAGFTVDQLKWIAVWSPGAKEVLASLQIK